MATRTKIYEDERRNMDQLLAVIESEMGPEAQLEVKEFRRGGMMGVGGRQMIQITASVEVDTGPRRTYRLDENWTANNPGGIPPRPEEAPVEGQPFAAAPQPAPTPATQPEPQPAFAAAPVETAAFAPPQLSADATLVTTPTFAPAQEAVARPAALPPAEPQPQPAAAAAAAPPAISTPATVPAGDLGGLEESIAELQSQVREMLVQQVSDVEIGTQAQQLSERTSAEQTRRRALAEELFERLVDSNILSRDARELVEAALDSGEGRNAGELLAAIAERIAGEVPVSGGIEVQAGGGPRVVAFVGATGGGKTGAVSKVAALHAFSHDHKVSIISLDTYRIAAVEQLRTYSQITGIPLQVAYSADDFAAALDHESASDLILVDTAGRSPRNPAQVHELMRIFAGRQPDEVHLVVPASTRADDLLLTTQAFAPLNFSRLVLSKLDETSGIGGLYNISRYGIAPLSFITTGQSVPEDLEVASSSFLRDWAAESVS